MHECISAISTARGASGVAIIRISGQGSLNIAEKMFKSKTKVCDFEPYKLYVGTIDCGDFSDFGMCVYFKAPKSYTGEDMIEFHCHGGIAITNGVLARTFELGARPATNGEFTKRAFLNGKLSLSSCEGLIDMINGESTIEAKCGFYLYREKLLNKIISVQNELTNILAQIDVDIDYPEDDVPSCDKNLVNHRLLGVLDTLNKLASTFEGASKNKRGYFVSIVGNTNAGKSSLLNTILKREKAIVTSVAGTTRDVVEGTIEINGVNFTFYDTAGIRESDDEVEKIGIQRSLDMIDKSDLIIYLIDANQADNNLYEQALEKIEKLNFIKVLNKVDVANSNSVGYDLTISAKCNINIDKLKELIFEKTAGTKLNIDADFITEERHYYAIIDAIKSIKQALDLIFVMPLDVLTVDLKDAWRSLGLISGSTCDQAVIDEIFAKFCVGK